MTGNEELLFRIRILAEKGDLESIRNEVNAMGAGGHAAGKKMGEGLREAATESRGFAHSIHGTEQAIKGLSEGGIGGLITAVRGFAGVLRGAMHTGPLVALAIALGAIAVVWEHITLKAEAFRDKIKEADKAAQELAKR